MKRIVSLITILFFIFGCVNLERNFKPAGFNTIDEVKPYIQYPTTHYLALQLSREEWRTFYKEFPEYWNDIQQANQFGNTMEYHPYYTAYAWRWTTLKRKQQWDKTTVQRLDKNKTQPGDNHFKAIYALGPPRRIIWNNDHEILIYEPDKALIMDHGVLKEIRSCKGCWQLPSGDEMMGDRRGMAEPEVLTALGVG